MSDDECSASGALVKGKAPADLLATKLPRPFPSPLQPPACARPGGGEKREKLVAALARCPAWPPRAASGHQAFLHDGRDQRTPIDGEAIYHRIGCVQCHSIGGAGASLGRTPVSARPPRLHRRSLLDPIEGEGRLHRLHVHDEGRQPDDGIPTRTATAIHPRRSRRNSAREDEHREARYTFGSLMRRSRRCAATRELNLISFLSQVSTTGPFDATKSNVARWWLFPSSVLASAVTPAAGPAVIASGPAPCQATPRRHPPARPDPVTARRPRPSSRSPPPAR